MPDMVVPADAGGETAFGTGLLMTLTGPALGYLFLVAYVLLPGRAGGEAYVLGLALAYIIGIVPSAIASWIYITVTRRWRMHDMAGRLVVAPIIGFATVTILYCPFYLSVSRGELGLIAVPPVAAAFAAFASVLLFDRQPDPQGSTPEKDGPRT